ncbi:MAG: hypothetical protein WCG75_05715 [Armatimonadota bacterium]
MKTFLSIILFVALVHATTAQAQTNDPPPVQPKNVLLAWLVLTALTVGIVIIIKVNSTLPSQTSPVTLVLEKSYYDGNWVAVSTNTVTLNGRTPIEVFRADMTDQVACYRARVVR